IPRWRGSIGDRGCSIFWGQRATRDAAWPMSRQPRGLRWRSGNGWRQHCDDVALLATLAVKKSSGQVNMGNRGRPNTVGETVWDTSWVVQIRLPFDIPQIQEKNGAIYTKPWVVELMLDLAGYTQDADLVD